MLWRVWVWTDHRRYSTLPVLCKCMCDPEYGGSPRGDGCRCNANAIEAVALERGGEKCFCVS